jgi:hypothetical protein
MTGLKQPPDIPSQHLKYSSKILKYQITLVEELMYCKGLGFNVRVVSPNWTKQNEI